MTESGIIHKLYIIAFYWVSVLAQGSAGAPAFQCQGATAQTAAPFSCASAALHKQTMPVWVLQAKTFIVTAPPPLPPGWISFIILGSLPPSPKALPLINPTLLLGFASIFLIRIGISAVQVGLVCLVGWFAASILNTHWSKFSSLNGVGVSVWVDEAKQGVFLLGLGEVSPVSPPGRAPPGVEWGVGASQ